jgi:hypothetical protein
MKLLNYFIIIALATGFNNAFAGKLKGKISHSSDNLREIPINPSNQRELISFFNMAKKYPMASLIVSADLDGDGVSESYSLIPGKDNNCDGLDNDCDGLVSITAEVKSIAETLVNRIGGTGLPTGKRMHIVKSQYSIYAYNGSITLNHVSETVARKTVTNDSLVVLFSSPSPEFRSSLRKGWDGSIKGITSATKPNSDTQITLQLVLDKTTIRTLILQRSDDMGRFEECESKTVCHDSLDSVLNLIR